MGDGRGPAHRSPAPAALLSAIIRRSAWTVHGSVPPAAPGMHRYSSTLLLHFLTGNLRDLLSVLEYQTTCYHGVRDGSVDGCSSIP